MNPGNKIDIVTDNTFKVMRSATNKMVDLIRPTFGPASNKVVISKPTHFMVVDDGVQIARDIELPDPKENAFVRVIRETAVKTNDRVGDGTTGALLMVQAIVNEVARRRKVDGRKVELELKRGLEEVQKHLKKSARQITTKEELKKVALISFDDEKIADMVADLYHKLGKDGTITIDKSPTMETTAELSEGTRLDHGYISPYMVNNPERMECVIENPYILLTDYRLMEATDILPIMEKLAAKGKRQLVIIAENVEGNALATLVLNLSHVINPETRKPGTFQAVAVTAPSGDMRKQLLEDLAIITGGKMFTESKGDKLENAEVEDLGRAQRFICRRDESVIVKPKGKKEDIEAAVSALRTAIEGEQNERPKKELIRRLGMFTNSIAVIKVGAPTESEQKALKYKFEDAVNAAKEAYQSGVVCGAGLSLASVKTSSSILNEALKYPARQLRENMGLDEDINADVSHVTNVVTGKSGKFMDVGVVDPVNVLLAGVESAVSIASILLTSSGMIVESAVKKGQE